MIATAVVRIASAVPGTDRLVRPVNGEVASDLETIPPSIACSPMTERQFDFRPILAELDGAAADLRRTLRAAIEEVLPKGVALSSRSCADRLGIDKTLGWACIRIATVADVSATLGALPGRPGWTQVIRGLRTARCPIAMVDAADAAFMAIYERMSTRGLGREAIRAIAAGQLDTGRERVRNTRIRKQMFEATRLVWGVSRAAAVGAHLVAPSRKDPSLADVASVYLVHDLQRHRLGPPWNVFTSSYSLRGAAEAGRSEILGAPLDPASGCPFMPEFSSPGSFGSELLGMNAGTRWICDFVDRSPTRRGPLRAGFGEVSRSIGPRWQTPDDPPIWLGMPSGTPTGWNVFDVLIHREITLATQPYASLYATIVHEPFRRDWADRTRLPLDDDTTIAPKAALPDPLRSISAEYRKVLVKAAAALGEDLDAFTIHRTVTRHQPTPTTMIVRFNLAEKPKG